MLWSVLKEREVQAGGDELGLPGEVRKVQGASSSFPSVLGLFPSVVTRVVFAQVQGLWEDTGQGRPGDRRGERLGKVQELAAWTQTCGTVDGLCCDRVKESCS